MTWQILLYLLVFFQQKEGGLIMLLQEQYTEI